MPFVPPLLNELLLFLLSIITTILSKIQVAFAPSASVVAVKVAVADNNRAVQLVEASHYKTTKLKMPSSTSPEKHLREKYDRMHAESIRKGMMATTTKPRSCSALQNNNGSTTSSSTIINDSINESLANLDRAEYLKDNGKQLQAMDLYEESIGTLIRHLKTIPEKDGNHDSIDRSVLAERVRVALTDAERLKKVISQNNKSTEEIIISAKQSHNNDNKHGVNNNNNNGNRRGSSTSPSSARSNSTTTTSSVKASFYSALGIGTSRSYESYGRKQQPSSNKSSLTKQQHPNTTHNTNGNEQDALHHSTKNHHHSTTPAPTDPVIPYYPQPHLQPQPQPTQMQPRKKRSNLDYTNNPLVQVVKSELYVDRSKMTTKWSDIVGLNEAKRAIQEAAILPLLRPDLYTGLRSPPRGILLYGPPGTGKTMLVRAAVHESECILFACTASALTSKWHGEGEKLLRTLFAVAADAAPSVLFFDEIDALLSSRGGGGNEHEASRRFKTEFMVQVDGISSGNNDGGDDLNQRLLVIGCTNCPWDIDEAIIRRFQRRIYVPLPDKDARRYLVNKLLKKEAGRHSLSSRQIESIVERTDGYSCSDLSAMAHEAAFGPLREMGGITAIRDCNVNDVRSINRSDFEDALKNTKRSVSNALLDKYRVWEDQQSATDH